jgi:hypothetical protein
MNTFQRTCMAAMMALALHAGPAAQAQQPASGSGRAVVVGKDSAAGRVVKVTYQGKYSFVRIEGSEPGAPDNQHPVSITPEALRAQLAQIMLKRRTPEPVMNEEELNEIAAPLSQALAQATSAQEVSFAVTGLHSGFGPLATRSVTTARVFQQGGQLNVIFGLVRNEFEGQLRGSGYLIAFEPGQRAKAVSRGVELSPASGASASNVRTDWIKFDRLAPPPAPAAAPAATPAAAPATAPVPVAAPLAPAVVAPASNPPVPAPAAPGNDPLYNKTADRLKALQRLRDEGLITEKEYQEKRKAILAEF